MFILILGLVLFIIGIVLLLLSLRNRNEEENLNIDKVPATITFIKTHRVGTGSSRKLQWTVKISYQYNGQTFDNVEYNSYDSTWKVGDIIEVSIDRNTGMFYHGEILTRKVLRIFAIILIFIGASMCIIFLVSGIILRMVLRFLGIGW